MELKQYLAAVQSQIGRNKMSSLKNSKTPQRGFTLVELMITISILVFLLFIGSSLTSAWIDRSQVDNGISSLKNAVFQAKTAALRNTNNQATTSPAVSVCWDADKHEITIVRAAANGTNACLVDVNNTPSQNYILHAFSVSKGIVLTVGNSVFECLAFNSSGILVAATGTSGACSIQSNLEIKIEKNNENAQIKIN